MQNTTDLVRIILLFTSIIVMGIGVYKDIKDRIYPNSIILSTILIGLIYGTISGHLFQSIFGFIVMNIIGIFIYKYNLMEAGDLKYLSSLFLFVNILDVKSCGLFILYILITGLIIGALFYKKLNKNMKEELKNELFSYKALALYKINTFKKVDFDNKNDLLNNTMAFTVPMYIAFILTIITSLFFSFI